MEVKELTEEVKGLIQSAKDSHSLMEMINTNGWRFLRKFYFDEKVLEYKKYLADTNNIDMAMIQATRLMLAFIETMLSEIDEQIKVGLEDAEELQKRKEKKKK